MLLPPDSTAWQEFHRDRETTSRHDPGPARIPPRQPVRVPLRVPADTGNPAYGEGAGSGRNKPSGGLPDRYGV